MLHGASLLILSLLAAGMASAQPRANDVEQIGDASERRVEQISTGSRDVTTERRAPPAASPPSQLSSEAESRGTSRQLTTEARNADAPRQLYRGGRTAQPSEALSRPAEGRSADLVVLEGEDKCDPAKAEAQRDPECRAVIERRAAQYNSPEAPVLSPEQKLLIEQRAGDRGLGTRDATRRLAKTGDDADSLDAQAIASVVLTQPAPPPVARPEEPAEPDAAQALIDAIVAGATQQPPPQP